MTAREVELTGGAPWGFRMHGGADHNQPIRISRVNPGRKASLCGIREGDVISSINGRPTKTMSNADAHAMLRSAGPVLRLGLNEDREALSRRRSIGKSNELKRPSQLLAEVQTGRATPQPPVYATIRTSQSPHTRPSSSIRSSLTSLPAALNSTPLVKSVASEESPKFHPTNPFYTTLPSNYSSASKLPVPNSRTPSLDKIKSETPFNLYGSDLKSPSFFTKKPEPNSGPTSLPYSPFNDPGNTNGYDTGKSTDSTDHFYKNKFEQFNNQSLPNDDKIKNPFDTKRNSDPFEKYLRPENKMNGNCDYDVKTIPSSMSDSNFRKEDIVKKSTITEHKISEVEEVKTIKKIILNGTEDSGSHNNLFKQSNNVKEFSQETSKQAPRKENSILTPTQQNAQFSTIFDQKENEEKDFVSTSVSRQSMQEKYNDLSAETSTNEVVTVKPPVATTTPSPTKRK